MGVDNELYTLEPKQDEKVYESSLIDLWNKITPINSTRIGATTVVNGKKVMNENKTFNTKPVEELSKQYADTKYETQDESAPYFYELENVDTGEKKYGIAPKGLDHRYAGQDISQWKVNYNKRRTDAVKLESLIHGNESMLKQKAVDLNMGQNVQLGKGASEIYTKGLEKVDAILSQDQKELTTKLVGATSKFDIAKPTTNENKSVINSLFGETLVDNISRTSSDVMANKKQIDMLSVGDYLPKETITDEANLHTSKEFMDKSKNVLNAFGVDIEGKSDKEVADIILKEQSKYGFNMTDMLYKVNAFADKDQQIAKDWLDIEKMKDKTDLSMRQVGDALGALATDPTSYAVLASMGTAIPARMIGQSALKQGLNTALGRGLLTGGLEGAAYSTADNLMRQKMGINADEQQSYNPEKDWESTAIGTGIGGALGGALGKLLGGNEQELINRELTKNVNTAPSEEQLQVEKLMGIERNNTEQDDKKFDFAQDVELAKKNTNTIVKTKPKEKINEPEVITKEQFYDEQEPKTIEKPKHKIVTKGGNIIDSKDVLESKKAVENIEFDVSSPTQERKPLEGNTYVPQTNNPKKFKLSYGDEGRVFTEDASLLSFQGTADQKASLKQRIKEGINNADDEVNRRLEFYDRDEQLRERYGRTEASFDERLEIPKSKADADRLRFQIEQYKDIRNNENLSTKVRRSAEQRLNDLYKNKVSLPKAPDEIATIAEQKFIESNPVERIADNKIRDTELRKEYELFMKANNRNKEGYEYKPSRTIEEVSTNVIKNAMNSKADIIKAIQKIKTKETSLGNKDFSEGKISPEIKAKYRDDITKIENYTGALEDVVAYRKGLLQPDEFMFRARRRVDDEVANAKGSFKSEEELDEFIDEVVKKYDETGTKVDKESIKKKLKEDFKSGKQNPEKKATREDNEKLSASKKHNALIKSLQEYKDTGKTPRYKSGQQAGKQALNSSQMRDVDEGILSFQEIANKTSPISTNAERKDAITKARESAAKKVNTTKAKKLGIKGRFKLPESIVFKDTVKDASNSVAQIITVLLGSRHLATVSKLLGTDSDVRSMIGKQMELDGMVLPKYPKDVTWKDVVKPLFMTENYGQMEKGLIENLMKAHKISKEEAKMYYDAYDKASDSVVKEMVEFKKAIYDTYYKEGKAKLTWTLPDGFVVNINLSKNKDGTLRIRDNELKLNIVTDNFDNFSRAIMPRMIHSVDAYVARRMNKAGFPMIHDAIVIPKGKEQLAEDTYTKIMQDINDSNLLHEIMTSIGYKGKPLKEGTLTAEDIAGSKYKLGTEHTAGQADKEGTKLRSFELGKQLTDEGVMKDYMASGNYRQIPTSRLVDALVNEAGYNNATLSLAREGDDAFERQVALAFQSPTYNKDLALKAPDGVNEKMWNKVQEEIFNEARAKLEYHPWLTDAVQGERKWFTKEGKIVGQYNKTYAEIYEELYQEFIKQHNTIAQARVIPSDKPLNKVNFRFNKNSKFTTTIDGITNKETFVKNVDNIAGKAKNETLTLGEAIVKSKIDEAKSNIVKSKWQDFKNLWKEQVDVEGKYKEFNILQKLRNIYRSEVDRDAEILYKDIMKMPKDKRDDIMLLLKSDYEAIDGMTKKEADEFFKDNNDLYTIAKRTIDDTAKGISSQSEQYGGYLNNAHLIATRYDLPKEVESTIDKLISIKAMEDNKAWDVLDKYTLKDEDVRFVLDTMKQKRMISEGELFVNSPEKIVKGYFSEVYRGNKKIDDNGKVRYDADDRYESVILGTERENNKVGTKVNLKDYLNEYTDIEDVYVNYFDPKGFNIDKLKPKQQKAFETLNMKYYLDERLTPRQEKYLGDLIKLGFDFENSAEGLGKKLDFMAKHRLKEGHEGFRKVTGEDIRVKAGKSQDLADILTETVRATNEKVKERGIVEKVLYDLAKDESLLFSIKPKDGMVELTKEQLAKLPYNLRAEMKYVDIDLIDKLVGRNEVRLYNGNNEHIKVADRLFANLGTMFKQNVVLKNPTSYLNAILVNHTIGATAGLTPKQMYKYQAQALKDIKGMQDLLEKLGRQKVTGKKLDEILFARLKNNQLYQLEKIGGLSTNRVDGVVGDNDLLGSILEDHVPSAIFKLARHLNLNQNTAIGKHTLRTFSKIDTMGRYMIAKKYMDDGMDIRDASDKANSLFGDMDTMVPPVIELLDKYGLAPFLKWFTLTHPGLFKLTKENPKKALAVAVGIYVFGQETDTNLASVNPIEGALDFVDATLTFGTIEKLQKEGLLDTTLNRARSNVVPRYMYNIYRSPETLGAQYYLKRRMNEPKSEDSVDYRGFTQKTVEGFTKTTKEDYNE